MRTSCGRAAVWVQVRLREFFREPDAHLGILSLGMSMGQWLCVPMILGGAGLWLWSGRRNSFA